MNNDNRTAAILAACAVAGRTDYAAKFIASGKSVADVKITIDVMREIDEVGKDTAEKAKPDADGRDAAPIVEPPKDQAVASATSLANMRRSLARNRTPATTPLSAGEQFLVATDPRQKSRAAMLAQCGHFPELRRGAR